MSDINARWDDDVSWVLLGALEGWVGRVRELLEPGGVLERAVKTASFWVRVHLREERAGREPNNQIPYARISRPGRAGTRLRPDTQSS